MGKISGFNLFSVYAWFWFMMMESVGSTVCSLTKDFLKLDFPDLMLTGTWWLCETLNNHSVFESFPRLYSGLLYQVHFQLLLSAPGGIAVLLTRQIVPSPFLMWCETLKTHSVFELFSSVLFAMNLSGPFSSFHFHNPWGLSHYLRVRLY